MEGIVNFGPNVASLFLTLGSRRCYIVREYVSPNDAPAVYHIEQDLEAAPKGMEVILLGDVNARMREPRDVWEDNIAATLVDCRLVGVISHFMPRR